MQIFQMMINVSLRVLLVSCFVHFDSPWECLIINIDMFNLSAFKCFSITCDACVYKIIKKEIMKKKKRS